MPGDTYDVINQRQGGTGPSLGVIDDTCEVHFEFSLQRGAALPVLTAKSVAFVGPPDFAPDRRPFLSAADELNDRDADAPARNAALSDDDLDRWVGDLFERVYETVSLFNVDLYRRSRAADLPPPKLEAKDIDEGARDRPTTAMGGRDALRNPLYKIAPPGDDDPLPLSEHARMRHRALSDLQNLIELISLDPNRLATLVRPPFEIEDFENPIATSMRMPPFMRQSNAQPLTLANWQYDLLMRWVVVSGSARRRAACRSRCRAPGRAGCRPPPQRGVRACWPESRLRRTCRDAGQANHRSRSDARPCSGDSDRPRGDHLLIVPHTRIFDLPPALAESFDADHG